MGIKEQGLLEYLEDSTRYADLMNGTIFGGKQVVKPEYLRDIQRKKRIFYRVKSGEETPDHVQKRSSSDNSGTKLMYLERERDILRLHDKPGEKFFLPVKRNPERIIKCRCVSLLMMGWNIQISLRMWG